jgi:hypothetical protein
MPENLRMNPIMRDNYKMTALLKVHFYNEGKKFKNKKEFL